MNNVNQNDLQPQPGDVLLIEDVQNDFLHGGSLAVPRGDEVVPVLNRYLRAFVASPDETQCNPGMGGYPRIPRSLS